MNTPIFRTITIESITLAATVRQIKRSSLDGIISTGAAAVISNRVKEVRKTLIPRDFSEQEVKKKNT